MSQSVTSHKLGWIALAGLLSVAVLGFLPVVDRTVQAQADNQLRGWAWSDNIGWISFNSQNVGAGGNAAYSVRLNSDETLEGYAWSDNIGWIRFDPSYTGVSGQGDNWGAKIVGDALTGWARACAVFASGCAGTLRNDSELGGWDGWIKMTNVDITVQADGTRKLGGFAWGDLNLGWVSFAWTDFGGGGGGNNDNPCPGGVCLPPGGENSLSCTVASTGSSNTYLFTGTGAASYDWYVSNGSSNDLQGSGSPFEFSFTEVGTYTVTMQPYDGSGVPLSPPISCAGNPVEITEGDPIPEEVCEISFVNSSDNFISYSNDNDLNLVSPKINLDVSVACVGEENNRLESNLDSRFDLVCASDQDGPYTIGTCANLTPGSYWISVQLNGAFPQTSFGQDDLSLQLFNGENSSAPLESYFDYSVVAGT